MSQQRRRTPLEETSVFADMSAAQRRELEGAGMRRHIPRGKLLFRKGERAAGIHVLLSGRLKSFRELPGGAEVVLHFVEAGEVFGEIAALLGSPYPANAAAVEDAEVFTLPLAAFKRLMGKEPEVGLLFMRGMAKKLSMLLGRIEAQKGQRGEQRVARSLLAGLPEQARPGAVFEVAGTKRLWADELGLQPETLSRALRRLADEGAIEPRGRREIVLRDPVLLAQFAAGPARTRPAPEEDEE